MITRPLRSAAPKAVATGSLAMVATPITWSDLGKEHVEHDIWTGLSNILIEIVGHKGELFQVTFDVNILSIKHGATESKTLAEEHRPKEWNTREVGRLFHHPQRSIPTMRLGSGPMRNVHRSIGVESVRVHDHVTTSVDTFGRCLEECIHLDVTIAGHLQVTVFQKVRVGHTANAHNAHIDIDFDVVKLDLLKLLALNIILQGRGVLLEDNTLRSEELVDKVKKLNLVKTKQCSMSHLFDLSSDLISKRFGEWNLRPTDDCNRLGLVFHVSCDLHYDERRPNEHNILVGRVVGDSTGIVMGSKVMHIVHIIQS